MQTDSGQTISYMTIDPQSAANGLGSQTITFATTILGRQTTVLPAVVPQWAGHDQVLPASLFYVSASNSGPTEKARCAPHTNYIYCPVLSFLSSSFPVPTSFNEILPEAFLFFPHYQAFSLSCRSLSL